MKNKSLYLRDFTHGPWILNYLMSTVEVRVLRGKILSKQFDLFQDWVKEIYNSYRLVLYVLHIHLIFVLNTGPGTRKNSFNKIFNFSHYLNSF